ncbi:recombination regulator RecX [Patescibacteria group bacterium]|nr:recombination regulator RecX [Patescibacteria group bacterium]
MDPYNNYLNTVLHFLSFRSRSEKEVRDKLLQKNAPLEIIEKIISKLKQQRFLNDEQFAKDWVRSRSTYRLKSKRIIKIELQKKGIDHEIIEKVLSPKDDEEFSDDQQVKKILEKRLSRYKGLPRNILYQKLGGFLARRGFNWDTIKKNIDDVLKSEYNK